jgi:hypothetical protein
VEVVFALAICALVFLMARSLIWRSRSEESKRSFSDTAGTLIDLSAVAAP